MQKAFNRQIDRWAQALQKRNNLDRIAYLKIKLGLEVFFNNLFKTIVVYGLALLFHVFLYTLTVHLSYFIIRHYAHGAHAKSTFACYIESIVLFVMLPLGLVTFNIPSSIIIILAVMALIALFIYAPAATVKQPIPTRLIKKKKIMAITLATLMFAMSFFVPSPYQQLILLGLILQGGSQLPIFFPKNRKDVL
ncbi:MULTISPECIES: accessory gene regulator AgrB [Staphylococcus]|uniref:accessory gene regulator AgrB n=1 Tax=Staphylococcus TaxID=1279 RepID=UPI000D02FE3D|nr:MULTISPECIES: accessory gene regulator AgrB [Staphylococcus]MCD8916121.1 accessory gene regulator AgrB [Staphylococcus simulans]UXV35846.1 accessory gene regulator AgrB [Staphylococcus sp. IVB6181]